MIFLSLFFKCIYFSINKKTEKYHQPFFLQIREHANLTFPLYQNVVNTRVYTYMWIVYKYVYIHIHCTTIINMGHMRIIRWANRLRRKTWKNNSKSIINKLFYDKDTSFGMIFERQI